MSGDGEARWWQMMSLMRKCSSMHSIFVQKDMTILLIFVYQTDRHLRVPKTKETTVNLKTTCYANDHGFMKNSW